MSLKALTQAERALLPQATRPLRIKRVRPGGPYDVRRRMYWMGPENAKAPDPEQDYQDADLAEILSMDPRGGLLILDPSYYCNLACTFCDLPIHSRAQVDWDRLRAPLRLLARCGMTRVVITGGEPGILPHLSRLVSDLRAWGYERIVLFTHGLWARNRRYLDQIVSAGVTDVTMSIKAFDDAMALKLAGRPRLWTQQAEALASFAPLLDSGRLRGLRLNHVITRDTLSGMAVADWLSHVPPGATLELCIVEPYQAHMVDQVPDGEVGLEALFELLRACDEHGIRYKIDGAPLCTLGSYAYSSGDLDWLDDLNLRVFIKPSADADYMLAHHGYQRILQYGYRRACDSCAAKGACIGLHKRYDEASWPLSPLAAPHA